MQLIKDLLQDQQENIGEIEKVEPVTGGDINDAYLIVAKRGSFFMKYNSFELAAEMFTQEKMGLDELRKGPFKIPEIVATGKNFLLLEWVDSKPFQPANWRNFGTRLAQQHKITSATFGFVHDNFIGSLHQHNSNCSSWTEFFIEHRLEFQLRMAIDSGKRMKHLLPGFEKLFHSLDNLYPHERPALLHGDLWSGNRMLSTENKPVLIDPAVYYGHREMDISMTLLFGGFDGDMYDSYQEAFPLENGFSERKDLWNIYPLMVHVNLFGGTYTNQVEKCLKRYI